MCEIVWLDLSACGYAQAGVDGDRQSGMPRRVFSEGLQKRFAQSRLAIEAGMAALRWLAKGYGYDITGLDVWKA